MDEIDRILRQKEELQRALNPMEEVQRMQDTLRKAQDPLGEMQRTLDEVHQTQNPLAEAQRALEEVRQARRPLKEIRQAQEALAGFREARDILTEVQRAQEPLRELERARNFLAHATEAARTSIEDAQSVTELEQLRVGVLGRSSDLKHTQRDMGRMPNEVRPDVGAMTNRSARDLEEAITAREKELRTIEREAQFRVEAVDVTLPGAPYPKGSLHPSMRVIDDVVDFFVGLGYRVAEGPEVETDYYNFTALNIPPGHPARTMQDTFFLDEWLVLRTHTSPVQIRTMLSQEPPVYVVCPGRTYRRDSDPTHTPMFNQIEGLAVDEDLTLGHLKGTLAAMARHVFGEDVKVRLRPSYFQFVEPGVELDVSCFVCAGSDPNCKVCRGAGWLEMLGAGMVDPAVLEEVGYDPERYTGFAFGMGPDRMAMVKYGIPDLRLFFEGDLRFLRQF